MRLLILSQWYKPEPVPKLSELAEGLTARGHQVGVLTGLPNYPSGTLYPGYHAAVIQKQLLDNIPIVRTYEFAYHGKRAIGRIWNYVSFMLSAPLGMLSSPKPDLIYVFHPPTTIGFVAFLISRLRRVPFIYDVQDVWPESAVVSGLLRPGFLVKVLAWMEKLVYGWAAHIMVVTEGARKNLILKGVPPAKISVMSHWVHDDFFLNASQDIRTSLRKELNWENKRIILFAGNIGLVQGLEVILGASERLSPNSHIKFVLMGTGLARESLVQETKARGLQNFVEFIDRQPTERMAEFYAAADILLVHLKRSELCDLVIPTKTIAYLAAGKPVLMAMEGAASELITAAKAGISIPAEDPAALAATATQFASFEQSKLDEMGASGRAWYLSHFTPEIVLRQYEELFSTVISQSS